MEFINETGNRYGMLLLCEVHSKVGYAYKYHATCDCGNKTVVYIGNARRGLTKSCGCNRKGKTGKGYMANHKKTYLIYLGMKRRCYNKNEKFYKHYGGRGITISDRWLASFDNFLSDMGDCPEGYSIERKDVNKGYNKENCVWLLRSEQWKNKSNNKLNEKQALSIKLSYMFGTEPKDICKKYGLTVSMVQKIAAGKCWVGVDK
jgi:hypothetical protein